MADAIQPEEVVKAKTLQAVEFYYANKHLGVSPYAAALKFSISPSAVYRKIRNLEETIEDRCPCCGQLTRKTLKLKD